MNILELADTATLYANDVCDADANADWYKVRDTKFAELVAAAERESCAELVEEVGRQTAAAIRARGDK